MLLSMGRLLARSRGPGKCHGKGLAVYLLPTHQLSHHLLAFHVSLPSFVVTDSRVHLVEDVYTLVDRVPIAQEMACHPLLEHSQAKC